jgi:hypothetical protein
MRTKNSGVQGRRARSARYASPSDHRNDRVIAPLSYRDDDLMQLTAHPARQLFVFDL